MTRSPLILQSGRNTQIISGHQNTKNRTELRNRDGGGPITVLFSESFEDTSFAARGWYDLPAGGITSVTASQHVTGSAKSLQIHWGVGDSTPTPNTSARMLFTPSDSVYLTYWIRHSANWVGSGEAFHPHQFHLLTNQDDIFVSPAVNHLTCYIEENYQTTGSYAVLNTQDASNIDTGSIGVDLTNTTESRSISGCNWNDPSAFNIQCFQDVGSPFQNARVWRSAGPVFLPSAGSNYKGDWQNVAAYFKLNTISGGKGQFDGVAQYWVNGQLVINQSGVLFRTGEFPNMKFNQFLMAPYIGDGSPVDQTMWIDELVVTTAPF